jgi:ABC-type cobalamin/Fe3+-siderophores transport system ATPase subunit
VEIGDARILGDICLAVMEREFVCVIGTSGGGKATLPRTIAGLPPAASGSVTLGGAPVPAQPRACRKSHPCWLSGSPVLVEDAAETVAPEYAEVEGNVLRGAGAARAWVQRSPAPAILAHTGRLKSRSLGMTAPAA